jgi:hypothetical protein
MAIDPDFAFACLHAEGLVAVGMYLLANVLAGLERHQHEVWLPAVQDAVEIGRLSVMSTWEPRVRRSGNARYFPVQRGILNMSRQSDGASQPSHELADFRRWFTRTRQERRVTASRVLRQRAIRPR